MQLVNPKVVLMQVMDQEDGCRHQLLPPGFRFHPMDDEIITHYLWEKVVDNNFKARAIGEVDLNKCEPWDLPSKAKNIGEKEWYFFCHKDRKYPTGMRTNRATEAGYWKATGKDKEIYKGKDNVLVGMKKTLVFYMGRAPKGEKTNWIMHEYRLEEKSCHHLPRNAKDEWSVCRVFNKKSETKRNSDGSNDQMMMMIDMTKSSSINPYLADDQLLESHSTLPHLINNTSTASNNLNDFNPFSFIPSTSTFHPQITPETLISPSSYLGKGKDMDYCLNQEMGSFKNEEHYYPHQSMQVTSSSQDTRISIDKDQEMSEEDVGCCQYYEEIENLWK